MLKNHWTEYWKTGALTSLPMDFKDNYDGELASYWQSKLKHSEKQALKVLDVCTGNGAIAILIKELAAKNNIEINMTAVDAADISPLSLIKNYPDKLEIIKSIDFIGGCLVEDMANELNQKFDLIVSQYGIEYCDTEEAAENVSQLLDKGGRLIFVAHNPDSAMHDYMKKEESVYAYLEGVHLFETFDRFGKSALTVNGFKNKLQIALVEMRNEIDFRSMDLFKTWVGTAMQLSEMSNLTLKTQRKSVKDFNLKYQHARARAQDMLNVTDKLLNQQDWYLTFEKYDLKLLKHDEIIYQQKHKVGHFYEFIKK